MRGMISYFGVVLIGLSAMPMGNAAGEEPDEAKRHELRVMGESSKQDADKDDGKHSFWFIGTSNYHLRLQESESKITRELDRTFRPITLGWERPTTFKDWSDDWRIWDLWGGYGRDINEKSSWAVYAGGGAGTVHNSNLYFPLGIPIDLDVDFTRRSLLLGSSISYYPYGRPKKLGRGLKKTLEGSRLMTEMNVGYTHQTIIGDVKASLPLIGEVLRIKDESKYHLFWASPRIGVEMPLTDSDSLNILGGYLLFAEHAREFDGFLLEFFVRHRF